MHAHALPEQYVVTRAAYLMGRDVRYPGSVTPEVEANVAMLLPAVNSFLEVARHEGVPIGIDEKTGTIVASGLRPLQLNDRTQNAAASSTHILGLGIDLQDLVELGRPLARFALRCARPGGLLEELGLFMERPQWTADWLHLQLKSPRSGRRVYVPSSASPLVAALPEEIEFVV
jgi:hypothetical protein